MSTTNAASRLTLLLLRMAHPLPRLHLGTYNGGGAQRLLRQAGQFRVPVTCPNEPLVRLAIQLHHSAHERRDEK